MRIALLSTCAVAVPPRAYGGTELVIAELAKMLTRHGHDVTVFATGDSSPQAPLRWRFRHPIWPPNALAELRHSAWAWSSICAEDPPFDLVHVHHAQAASFSAVCDVPTVLTLHHERVDELVDFYRDLPEVTYVGVSRRQAELVPELGVSHVVHHGLDAELYELGDGAGGWLAFVGRFAAEKGPHVAIDVAVAAGIPLRMGGRPHWVDERYFAEEVRPRLARAGAPDGVTWHDEVDLERKLAMLRGARATLFPIAWEEPFGLVMIESMLVGTPVVAFARGAAPEVIDEGVTGFLVRNTAEMLDRVRGVAAIDRRRCRARARQRFGSARMARDYARVYAQALRAGRTRRPAAGRARLARVASG
jgi:glycosyltransferase involved in cell wall biosynthesis